MTQLHRRRYDTAEKIVIYAASIILTISVGVFVMLIDKYMEHEKETAYQIALFNYQVKQLTENIKEVQRQQSNLIVKFYTQNLSKN